jgi:hypothetical protein
MAVSTNYQHGCIVFVNDAYNFLHPVLVANNSFRRKPPFG